ncbi:hypothetical protein ABPG72_022619 [Tetrahymena utriculariae]
MSISFSQIPQVITAQDSPKGRDSSSNIKRDSIKVKVPTLQEKLQNKIKNEEIRINEQTKKLLEQLEQNKRDFQLDQVKLHKSLIKQKKLENYQLLKSMSDGQPKHPHDFKKANKELEVFKERGFLLPTIEEARQEQQLQKQKEKFRQTYLKAKAVSQIEIPFFPTTQVPKFFDNIHLIKNTQEYQQASSQYPTAQKKLGLLLSSNNIKSLQNIQMPNDHQRSPEKSVNKGSQMQQSQIELFHLKPTSANNLALFQQQLHQQNEEISQYKNAKSMNSISSLRRNQHSMSNISTEAGSQQKNKEWINAYHQKEIFSRPLYNNLDIKLQGNNPHFKPFKPTKTQGYNFNKYISLDAGERDSKTTNLKKFQDVQAINFENEPFEIRPPTQFKSLTRINNY